MPERTPAVLSLADAIALVNQDAATFFDADLIEADCSAFGHCFRHRKLSPRNLVLHFLRQVMVGNTSCTHVSQFGDAVFTPSAYCRARQALPLEVIESLQLRTAAAMSGGGGTWCGRRTVLLDGTSCSMPDTDELREHFGYPGGQKPGLGFPSAHVLCLFNHATGLLLENIVAPRATNDLEGLPDILRFMREEDVLVADRAFGCFVAMALCRRRNADAVLRLNTHVLVDFTPERPHDSECRNKVLGSKRRRAKRKAKGAAKGLPKSRWVRRLGELDQVVAYRKARTKSAIISEEEWESLPEEIEVREIRFRVDKKGWRPEEITLVTTLLDAARFPKEKIIELYLARWRVEGNIRDLKQTLKMDTLKGKSVDVVKKEIAMHAIAYNLIQLVRMASAKRRGLAPDRIGFADAMRWLSGSRSMAMLAKLVVNKLRPGRFDVRAVKRRAKPHDFLTRPRWEIKAEILSKIEAQQAEKQRLAA